jgi:hypothetical protein
VDSIPYVPVRSFFDFIGIQSTIDPENQRIEGFFRSPDTTYEIDLRGGSARFNGEPASFSGRDLFFDHDSAYLRIGFLSAFFGINVQFNPKHLTIDLRESDRLPGIIFQRRHALLARRGAQRQAIPAPETTYPRDVFATGAGRLNWHISPAYTNSDAYSVPYSASLGMKLVGGDLTLTTTGIANPRRSKNTTRGQFRIPFPESESVTQIVLGYLTPFPYYYGEMIGGEITNRPLGRPRVFSTDIFQGTLAPRADLEVTGLSSLLTVTDQNGLYQLDLPVPYGFGSYVFRATDQFGRTQEIEYRVRTLTDMIRPGKVEYSVVMGKQNSSVTTFTSSSYLSWGVASALTIGGRLDYFDFPSMRQKLFPALTAASRLASELTFEGFVSPALISRFSLDWTFLEQGTLVATETRYGSSLEINPTGAIMQHEATLSVPLFSEQKPLLVAASGRVTDYPIFQDRTLQLGVNKQLSGFSVGLSLFDNWRRSFDLGETKLQNSLTNLTLRLELPSAVNLTTSWTYDNLVGELAVIQVIATKSIMKNMFVNVSYFNAPNVPSTTFGIQVQYRFPFATLIGGALHSDAGTSYSLLGYGSMAFDVNTPYLSMYGYPQPFAASGFDFNPFVDQNGNGKQDAGEQSLTRASLYYGEELPMGGLSRVPSNQLSVRNLVPYSRYIVSIDPQGIEDPTLVPKSSVYRIFSESNYNRRINIPIVPACTIHGNVEQLLNNARVPLQGMKVRLISQTTKRVRETTTFSTGEFEFGFLPPDEFRVELDEAQVSQIGMVAEEVTKTVSLGGTAETRVVGDINFVLKSR